ncbi:MAG: hypothetical protein DRI69_02420 [Bacteroidetes bacterium]|nr:MAG: hypothetical protein DRI69_02420 [Bacteroidota bacterium]
MSKLIFFFCLLGLFAFTTDATAQKKVRIKPEDRGDISMVKMEVGDRVFPKSMLYRVHRKTMTVVKTSMDVSTGEEFYIPVEIDINEFDYITIYNRKRKRIGMLIGGVSLGLASYFVADQLSNKSLDQPSIEILGQAPQTGFIEPIVAGILGGGIGVILGDILSPLRINVKKDRKEAYEKLKRYSYR